MKKYVKPDLSYENFELSVGVASCAIQLNKDGSYKGYYGSVDFGSAMMAEMVANGGFGNTTVCQTIPEIYDYFGSNNESMMGS